MNGASEITVGILGVVYLKAVGVVRSLPARFGFLYIYGVGGCFWLLKSNST